MTATATLPSLDELLKRDLDYVCANLREEFGRMAGKRLLITGGAGFLGYYLVHAALHFNATAGRDQPIRVTVWDSFIRGRPAWLQALAGTAHLEVERIAALGVVHRDDGDGTLSFDVDAAHRAIVVVSLDGINSGK